MQTLDAVEVFTAAHCRRCSDGRDAPSCEAWIATAPLIEDLYSWSGYSLKEVQEQLHRLNHHASERQYKTKFKAWGLKPKRISRIHYIAMKRVMDAHPQYRVIFSARRGTRPVEIVPLQVLKELGRHSGQNNLSTTLEEAEARLSQAGFSYHFEPSPVFEPDAVIEDTPHVLLAPRFSSVFEPDAVVEDTPHVLLAPRFSPGSESDAATKEMPHFLLPSQLKSNSVIFGALPDEGLDFPELGDSLRGPSSRSFEDYLPSPKSYGFVNDGKAMVQRRYPAGCTTAQQQTWTSLRREKRLEQI
jgi:hypothetical protein